MTAPLWVEKAIDDSDDSVIRKKKNFGTFLLGDKQRLRWTAIDFHVRIFLMKIIIMMMCYKYLTPIAVDLMK